MWVAEYVEVLGSSAELETKTRNHLPRLSYRCCLGTEVMWRYERVMYDALKQPVFSSTEAVSPQFSST